MKNVTRSIIAIVICSCLNIAIFLVAYKTLVFPFLHEDQRMDNAPYIFFYVIPGFVLAAVVVILISSFCRSMGSINRAPLDSPEK